MNEHLLRAIHLIGSLYAYALIVGAMTTYVFLWPFDRQLRAAR